MLTDIMTICVELRIYAHKLATDKWQRHFGLEYLRLHNLVIYLVRFPLPFLFEYSSIR